MPPFAAEAMQRACRLARKRRATLTVDDHRRRAPAPVLARAISAGWSTQQPRRPCGSALKTTLLSPIARRRSICGLRRGPCAYAYDLPFSQCAYCDGSTFCGWATPSAFAA